ncbi:50S ribosomal protein L30 [Pseudodesulfovibrio tunisiensis]|uniref:50S ribosomal protein L30 n=1 Tax=Pseudodesulfovibrio tunisiensis TaxID=463192 RepID=UPI001FB4A2D7|nr:50S ribosomal protein L30 [Pseudodesulfovibrio tunisiensis]
MLKVKLIKSKIGCNPAQRKTLVALGLRKIRQEKTFEDTPVVRGMIKRVNHLVEVTES